MINFEIKNQNGRSMIEMLGVLAIIGVLSVGGIAGYSKAMQRYRINKAIEQITLIAGNIRTFFKGNYIGVACDGNGCKASGCYGVESTNADTFDAKANGCPIIKKAKILPDEMITVENGKIMSITNPFGYSTSISSDYPFNSFHILYRIGDNEEVCIEMMTHDWTNANVRFIVLYSHSSPYYFQLPVSIDTAVTYCAKAKNDATPEQRAAGQPYIYFFFDVDATYYNSLPWLN